MFSISPSSSSSQPSQQPRVSLSWPRVKLVAGSTRLLPSRVSALPVSPPHAAAPTAVQPSASAARASSYAAACTARTTATRRGASTPRTRLKKRCGFTACCSSAPPPPPELRLDAAEAHRLLRRALPPHATRLASPSVLTLHHARPRTPLAPRRALLLLRLPPQYCSHAHVCSLSHPLFSPHHLSSLTRPVPFRVPSPVQPATSTPAPPLPPSAAHCISRTCSSSSRKVWLLFLMSCSAATAQGAETSVGTDWYDMHGERTPHSRPASALVAACAHIPSGLRKEHEALLGDATADVHATPGDASVNPRAAREARMHAAHTSRPTHHTSLLAHASRPTPRTSLLTCLPTLRTCPLASLLLLFPTI